MNLAIPGLFSVFNAMGAAGMALAVGNEAQRCQGWVGVAHECFPADWNR